MTKIAFISTMEDAPWGGSEELWGQAATRLASQVDITVGVNIVRWPNMPIPLTEMAKHGAIMVRRPHPSAPSTRIARRCFGETAFQWLDMFRPDIAVISQGGNADGVPWMMECIRRQIPYVTIAQMANDNYWPSWEVVQTAMRAYQGAQINFFVSQANLALTERQIACRLPNAKVVRNPFHVNYDVALPWPNQGNCCRLACVGRLTPNAKGQDILLEVLGGSKWKERLIEVAFYGTGPGEMTLPALAKMLGVNCVSFRGYSHDVTDIWASNHLLVLPSRFEGLPITIVEALLCGRPCVVTDIAGNSELIEDNVTGFVAAAPSARCLDEALERAWQRRDEWKQIGQTGAARVRELVPPDPTAAFLNHLMSLPLLSK